MKASTLNEELMTYKVINSQILMETAIVNIKLTKEQNVGVLAKPEQSFLQWPNIPTSNKSYEIKKKMRYLIDCM